MADGTGGREVKAEAQSGNGMGQSEDTAGQAGQVAEGSEMTGRRRS